MAMVIERISGLEILDSRGRPTVQATCVLQRGAHGTASVPSGASTGAAEAWELRDGDPCRFGGWGCSRAVRHVEEEIGPALAGRSFEDQAALDKFLVELDGTPHKKRLGANAILAVSLAFSRASSLERGVPLWRYYAGLLGQTPTRLPRPTINLFSGGKHAGGQVGIQDVLVVPTAARTMAEALAMTYDVYQAAARVCHRRYQTRPLVADEGGLAPNFPDSETMIQSAVEAIGEAGWKAGSDFALAIDVASSHFYQHGAYTLDGVARSSEQMVDLLTEWTARYPILSLEDGLAEEDWEHWPALLKRIPEGVWVMGDDLLCSNPERIRRAQAARAANALLLKVNQIGTLSEAAEAAALAARAGWHVTISARSGETEDDWLADLAVGWQGDHIKVGSITRSERLAKYNRLLAIEKELHLPLA